MNDRERKQRLYTARQAAKLRKGRISRREFLRRVAVAGFGVSTYGLMGVNRWRNAALPELRRRAVAGYRISDELEDWLKEVGGRFAGQTIRISSESTPPSQITNDLAQEIFVPLTGINVQWEQTPLDQVLSKITLDTATEAASNDIYYLDQAWVGRFVEDTVDPMSYMEDEGNDLNMPDYDWEDFVPELVPAISAYRGRQVGVPFDIPIFIVSYRSDVLEELGLEPPTNMEEYLNVVQTVGEAGLTNEDGSNIYGYAGQWRSGHYSLQCDWTSWLWSHGGSHTGPDGEVVLNDENGIAGAEYMMKLAEHSPPGATTWDWSGAGDAFAQGLAAINNLWGEFFPLYDHPENSKIFGLAEPLAQPEEIALRTPEETSFDETPGIGHQGGSCLAISKYSENPDAAWVFLQWATSKETIFQASLQSNAPVRTSTYEDPRTKEREKPGVGSTRHFPVMLKTIKEDMGTEPHFPGWAATSGTGGPLPTELGLMTTGQQDVKTTLDNMAAAIEESIAETEG